MHKGLREAAKASLLLCRQADSSPQAASRVLPAGCLNASPASAPCCSLHSGLHLGSQPYTPSHFPSLPLLQASSAMLESDYAMPVKSKKGAIPFFDEDEPEAYCAPAFNSGVVDIEAPMVVGETGEGEEPEGGCLCRAACIVYCRRHLDLLGRAAEGALVLGEGSRSSVSGGEVHGKSLLAGMLPPGRCCSWLG